MGHIYLYICLSSYDCIYWFAMRLFIHLFIIDLFI